MKLKIFILKKNAVINPIIRNGPNGISLFIVNCFLCKYNDEINASPTPKRAPIQKDNMIAETPADKPSIHPIPTTSFPSPKPIHLPSDISHKKKKNKKNRGPAAK